MPLIVVSPSNVASFPDGGGHFWVYMQYVHGLRQLGCRVVWLERFERSGDPAADALALSTFRDRMNQVGLENRVILYEEQAPGTGGAVEYIGVSADGAEKLLREADLLLNFDYAINASMLACFRRTALVDIDPGLLQFWISTGQLNVHPHDYYFTTGETVGTPAALFPDCGLKWNYIRPPLCLDLWPYVFDPGCEAFTTVSSWWGDEWIYDGRNVYENNKRVSFMEFAALAGRSEQVLELAIFYGEGDAADLDILHRNGWRIRHSREVSPTPGKYQAYIQNSRGEFSCAKPSCMKFQNAWISDRTLCYLATGKPVVVQNTGPSSFLPDGEGLFRFSTLSGAAAALDEINSRYERHCRAAREVVETYFDSSRTLEPILTIALSSKAGLIYHAPL